MAGERSRRRMILVIAALVIWEASQIAVGTYLGVRLACEMTQRK